MTPDDVSHAEALGPVLAAVADAEWAQARDALRGDMASHLTATVQSGGCARCADLIRRYEDLTRPPARVIDAYRATFGDLGGGSA